MKAWLELFRRTRDDGIRKTGHQVTGVPDFLYTEIAGDLVFGQCHSGYIRAALLRGAAEKSKPLYVVIELPNASPRDPKSEPSQRDLDAFVNAVYAEFSEARFTPIITTENQERHLCICLFSEEELREVKRDEAEWEAAAH